MRKTFLLLAVMPLALWVQAETKTMRKQLIATYYAKGDYSNATQYLTALPDDTKELLDFAVYYNLLINAASNNRNIYTLNTEELTEIEALAESGETTASLAARGILGLTQNKVYDMAIERAVEEQNLMKKQVVLLVEPKQTEKAANNTLLIYPNPADNSLHVSHNLFLENSKVVIKDVIGKSILEETISDNKTGVDISTFGLSNGIYFVLLVHNNAVLEVKKVIINH